ncbi:lipopolysaccharide kinase InaA family protein [Chryseobacterium sp. POE27]|uniref:lipopolysaccharide kinase InaA family protein n=1 Tax=Chryseobacterium sp. POE27 TaxID=3138177 RepID=UPI00321C1BB0
MKMILAEGLSYYKEEIIFTLKKFHNEGILIGDENRNIVKYFYLNGAVLNFKLFRQRNILSRQTYKFYRKSKAKLSFEHAQLLISKNFRTPKPVAYIERYNFTGLTSCFYISEQIDNSTVFTDILDDKSFVDREKIIRQYTSLMYDLHNNGINFVDNSSGNFVIKKLKNDYQIYLVDLDKMNFYDKIETDKRLKNLAKLTCDQEIIAILASEYSALSEIPEDYCFKKLSEASDKKLLKSKKY